MIGLIKGQVAERTGARATIMTPGGAGYEALLSLAAQKYCAVGAEVTLITYLAVRENALELYAFGDAREKKLFELFIGVSGVGPKTALHLLELGTAEEIRRAIGRGDVGYLAKASGIGAKTAERLVVELRSKLKEGVMPGAESPGTPVAEDPLSEVIDGLVALGYSTLEAREATRALDANGKNSEQLLREALRRVK